MKDLNNFKVGRLLKFTNHLLITTKENNGMQGVQDHLSHLDLRLKKGNKMQIINFKKEKD